MFPARPPPTSRSGSYAWPLKLDQGWAYLVLGFILMALVFLVFIWGLVHSSIKREEQLAIETTIRRNVNISTIAKANLEQVIGKITIYAKLASALVNGDSSVAKYLNPTTNGDQAFLRIIIFDKSGNLLHSSARQSSEPEARALVEEATQFFRLPLSSTDILVGRPNNTRNMWRIPLVIGVGGVNELQGALVAILDLGYFLRLFRDVDIGNDGRIEIIGVDGFQLAEFNGATLSSGKNYQNSEYQNFLLKKPFGFGIVKKTGESVESISAYCRLDNYPLIVVTTRNFDDALSETRVWQKNIQLIAALVSLLILLGAAALVRLTYLKHHIHRALKASETENRDLIEQLEQKSKHAFQLASHDHLTGLPNRMLFSELAVAHLSRARRSRHYHAIFFIDLDHFKTINDTLGHRIGDLLLKEVAGRYRSCLRESDIVARFGGDEFVMHIGEVESIEDIGKVAQKIVAAIKIPFLDLDGHDIETSPSIGIAIYPQDGEDIENLLRHADVAMYAAKASGRGTYHFYDEALNQKSKHEMELLRDLRHAIRAGELVLHYQPRVDARDFSLTGLEALVRWKHPEFGLIFPNDFIALAEKNDLIIPLGRKVLELTCEQLVDWQRREIQIVPVSVNISAKQLKDESFVTDFINTIALYGVPTRFLEIELTESCFVENTKEVADKLAQLAAQGINISIDDYGTGFANIGHLKDLPVHAIKIDRSFIRDIHNVQNDAIIVDSIITLAQKLGLLVVAEGVETKDQLTHLKSVGCNQFQGYYFHRPVVAEEIENILHQRVFTP